MMGMTNMNMIDIEDTRRRRRILSLEDKKKLYQQWKASNQSKQEFCKSGRVSYEVCK
jgi:hypothetical protein